MDFRSQRPMAWYHVIFLAAASAVLSALSHPPCHLAILAWVSLVPWLYSLPYQTLRQTLAGHAVYVVCFFGLGISWMGKVHPLCPIVILLPLYFICLPFPLIYRWIVREKTAPAFFAAPIVWCAGDYLRSFIISGFPYLYPGHTQAFYPVLIQVADVTGVYGVTFAVVLVNSLAVSWLHYWVLGGRMKYQLAYTATAAAILAMVILYGRHCLATVTYPCGPKIATIQGNIPQDIKDDVEINRKRVGETYDRMTVEALLRHPDARMLVWPETMAIADPMADPSSFLKFRDIARNRGLFLLIGAHHLKLAEDDSHILKFNSAYFLNPGGEIAERYDKTHLVIMGEYLPFKNTLTFLPNLVSNIAGFLPDLLEGERRPVFTLDDCRFGTLICYDIVYAAEVRDLKRKGCQFIVNVTNEGWFAYTGELEQMLTMSIFRAVENRIGILRAGNTGITGNIPPTGEIIPGQLLTVPPKDFLPLVRDYTPFVAERLSDNSIAWHHFPQCIWQKGIPCKIHWGEDWDAVVGGERVKWKDFPAIFCQRVPLSSPGESWYTKVGDLFAQILSAVATLLAIATGLRRHTRQIPSDSA